MRSRMLRAYFSTGQIASTLNKGNRGVTFSPIPEHWKRVVAVLERLARMHEIPQDIAADN